jgi:hypothetical protein
MRACSYLLESQLVKAMGEILNIPRSEFDLDFIGTSHSFSIATCIHHTVQRSRALTECRQFDEIGLRYLFYWLPSLAPCSQTSSDDERAKSLLSE